MSVARHAAACACNSPAGFPLVSTSNTLSGPARRKPGSFGLTPRFALSSARLLSRPIKSPGVSAPTVDTVVPTVVSIAFPRFSRRGIVTGCDQRPTPNIPRPTAPIPRPSVWSNKLGSDGGAAGGAGGAATGIGAGGAATGGGANGAGGGADTLGGTGWGA